MIIYKVQIRRAALSQLTRHLVNGSSKETHQLLVIRTLFWHVLEVILANYELRFLPQLLPDCQKQGAS